MSRPVIMAKLMSKKTREIVQTTTVLVVIALFVAFYIVYPLITVPRLSARQDREKFEDPAFIPENDPHFFLEKGFRPDTFSVSTDDNIILAGLYFYPDTIKCNPIRGTVVLIHPVDTDRTFMEPYLQELLDSGFATVVYDQRACGLSTGRYHFAGVFEAEDLSEVITHLSFHERLYNPVIVVGFELGADAAIYASRSDGRIADVIAVDPYITSSRWISKMKDVKGALSIPLYNMVYFWWFQKVTSFSHNRTGLNDIKPVGTRTLLIAARKDLESREVRKLIELDSTLLGTITKPADENAMAGLILKTIFSWTGK
jgi:pimeloyl-ACP methyl ester carboxylesterase